MSLKNRLLIFANDPASAAITLAYAYIYKDKYSQILAYPKNNIAKDIYQEYIPDSIMKNEIKFQNMDTVVTGTSGIDPSYEINAIIKAKKANVNKTIVIVDNTIHFNMRFQYEDSMIPEKYLSDEIWIFEKGFISNTNYINKKFIYTEDIYKKFLNIVFKKNKPKTTHPFINKYKDNYLVILTEYIYDFYRLEFGFNEYDMLEYILKAVENSLIDIPIFIKLHPKEHNNKFNILLRKYSNLTIVQDLCNIQELIYYSKVVFGMNSSVFKECELFKKPTYSIQINSNKTILPLYIDRTKIICKEKTLLDTINKHFNKVIL